MLWRINNVNETALGREESCTTIFLKSNDYQFEHMKNRQEPESLHSN